MGKRDYRHREDKKQKKTEKKLTAGEILSTPAPVEVIKKGKRGTETEE